ncbi:MAG: SPOR domain-containing protein [Bacteroidia bacterium]|nr:SPOR domain-containing protein [Bacteroidia bacterium]
MMKRFHILTLLLMMASALIAEERTSITFFQGTFEQLKTRAQEERKPFFISFHTAWSTPCQNMTLYTYTNPDLITYVQDNYLAFQVDAESPDRGESDLAQEFDVIFFPTIIVFNDKAEVVSKFSGFKNAADLKSQLVEFRRVSEEKPLTENKPAVSFLKPAVPKPAPTTSPASTTAKEKTATLKTTKDLVNTDVGLFRMSLEEEKSSGYGVQVGVFGDYANVMREVSALEIVYKQSVMVSISKLNNNTVFKVLVGPFDSQSQAVGFQKLFQERESRTAMIVNLDTYK